MGQVDRDALRALVKPPARSARAISLEAGLGATAVKDILSGKSRQPSFNTITAIARALDVPVDELWVTGEGDARQSVRRGQIVPRFLPVRYRVQAGHWIDVDLLAQDFPEPPRAVAPDPDYGNWPQWLELVCGDSINLLIGDGSFAHVVDAIEMGYAPRNGDLVVVERRRDGGMSRERTIKEVEVISGKVSLWPRSSNPKWSQPIVLDDRGSAEEVEVEIVGLVIGFYRSMKPRREA